MARSATTPVGHRKGRSVALFVVAVVLLSALDRAEGRNSQADRSWSPDAKSITQLEGLIRLPPGAFPLVNYGRFYTGFVRKGHHIVKAIYIGSHGGAHGSVHIVENLDNLPGFTDGGCDAVNIEYDADAQVFTYVFCNGLA
jgi:hypothetical protein